MIDTDMMRDASRSRRIVVETDDDGFGVYEYPPVTPANLPVLVCWVAASLVAVALLAVIEQLHAGPDLLSYLT